MKENLIKVLSYKKLHAASSIHLFTLSCDTTSKVSTKRTMKKYHDDIHLKCKMKSIKLYHKKLIAKNDLSK